MDDSTARHLKNLANPDPIARLKAIHELGDRLQDDLTAWIDAAELAQVHAARSKRPQPSWETIGRALGVTGQQAGRRFRDRV